MSEKFGVSRLVAWLQKRFTGERRAAWEALERFYWVPYLRELSSREHHGMVKLEHDGIVHRDNSGSGLHWHLTEKGRSRA